MSDAIIVALIAGLCSVVGNWLITHQQTEKRRVEDAVRDARQEDRLSAIERKLDIHNGYAEKFSEIGKDIAVIKTEIKTLYEKGA
jgi:hypothetical protein